MTKTFIQLGDANLFDLAISLVLQRAFYTNNDCLFHHAQDVLALAETHPSTFTRSRTAEALFVGMRSALDINYTETEKEKQHESAMLNAVFTLALQRYASSVLRDFPFATATDDELKTLKKLNDALRNIGLTIRLTAKNDLYYGDFYQLSERISRELELRTKQNEKNEVTA